LPFLFIPSYHMPTTCHRQGWTKEIWVRKFDRHTWWKFVGCHCKSRGEWGISFIKHEPSVCHQNSQIPQQRVGNHLQDGWNGDSSTFMILILFFLIPLTSGLVLVCSEFEGWFIEKKSNTQATKNMRCIRY
jgi:hypothetical protein